MVFRNNTHRVVAGRSGPVWRDRSSVKTDPDMELHIYYIAC